MKKFEFLSRWVGLSLALGLGLGYGSSAFANDVTYTNKLLNQESGNVIENVDGVLTLVNSQVVVPGNIPTFLANLATNPHDWNAAIKGGWEQGIGLVSKYLRADMAAAGGLAGNAIVNVGSLVANDSILIAGDKVVDGVTTGGVVLNGNGVYTLERTGEEKDFYGKLNLTVQAGVLSAGDGISNVQNGGVSATDVNIFAGGKGLANVKGMVNLNNTPALTSYKDNILLVNLQLQSKDKQVTDNVTVGLNVGLGSLDTALYNIDGAVTLNGFNVVSGNRGVKNDVTGNDLVSLTDSGIISLSHNFENICSLQLQGYGDFYVYGDFSNLTEGLLIPELLRERTALSPDLQAAAVAMEQVVKVLPKEGLAGLTLTGFSGGNIALNVQGDVEGSYAGLVALHNGFEQIGGDVKLLGKGYHCFYLETKSGTKYLDDGILLGFTLAAKGDAITNVTGKVELGGDYESVYDGKQNTYTINKDEGVAVLAGGDGVVNVGDTVTVKNSFVGVLGDGFKGIDNGLVLEGSGNVFLYAGLVTDAGTDLMRQILLTGADWLEEKFEQTLTPEAYLEIAKQLLKNVDEFGKQEWAKQFGCEVVNLETTLAAKLQQDAEKLKELQHERAGKILDEVLLAMKTGAYVDFRGGVLAGGALAENIKGDVLLKDTSVLSLCLDKDSDGHLILDLDAPGNIDNVAINRVTGDVTINGTSRIGIGFDRVLTTGDAYGNGAVLSPYGFQQVELSLFSLGGGIQNVQENVTLDKATVLTGRKGISSVGTQVKLTDSFLGTGGDAVSHTGVVQISGVGALNSQLDIGNEFGKYVYENILQELMVSIQDLGVGMGQTGSMEGLLAPVLDLLQKTMSGDESTLTLTSNASILSGSNAVCDVQSAKSQNAAIVAVDSSKLLDDLEQTIKAGEPTYGRMKIVSGNAFSNVAGDVDVSGTGTLSLALYTQNRTDVAKPADVWFALGGNLSVFAQNNAFSFVKGNVTLQDAVILSMNRGMYAIGACDAQGEMESGAEKVNVKLKDSALLARGITFHNVNGDISVEGAGSAVLGIEVKKELTELVFDVANLIMADNPENESLKLLKGMKDEVQRIEEELVETLGLTEKEDLRKYYPSTALTLDIQGLSLFSLENALVYGMKGNFTAKDTAMIGGTCGLVDMEGDLTIYGTGRVNLKLSGMPTEEMNTRLENKLREYLPGANQGDFSLCVRGGTAITGIDGKIDIKNAVIITDTDDSGYGGMGIDLCPWDVSDKPVLVQDSNFYTTDTSIYIARRTDVQLAGLNLTSYSHNGLDLSEVENASLGISRGNTICAVMDGISITDDSNLLLKEYTSDTMPTDRETYKDYRINSLYDDYRTLVAGAGEHVLTVLSGGMTSSWGMTMLQYLATGVSSCYGSKICGEQVGTDADNNPIYAAVGFSVLAESSGESTALYAEDNSVIATAENGRLFALSGLNAYGVRALDKSIIALQRAEMLMAGTSEDLQEETGWGENFCLAVDAEENSIVKIDSLARIMAQGEDGSTAAAYADDSKVMIGGLQRVDVMGTEKTEGLTKAALVVAMNGSEVSLAGAPDGCNVQVQSDGVNPAAVIFSKGDNVVNLSNMQITVQGKEHQSLINADGGMAQVTLNNVQVLSPADLHTTNNGVIELTLQNGSSFAGAAVVEHSVGMFMALLSAPVSEDINIEIDENSVWQVTGDSEVATLNNAGTVDMTGDAGAGSTLTAGTLTGEGNYVVDASDGAIEDKIITGSPVKVRNLGLKLAGVETGESLPSTTLNLTDLFNGAGGAEFADDAQVFITNSGTGNFIEQGALRYEGFVSSNGQVGFRRQGRELSNIATAATSAVIDPESWYLDTAALYENVTAYTPERADEEVWAQYTHVKNVYDNVIEGGTQHGDINKKYDGAAVGFDKRIRQGGKSDTYLGVLTSYGDGKYSWSGGSNDMEGKGIGIYLVNKAKNGAYLAGTVKYNRYDLDEIKTVRYGTTPEHVQGDYAVDSYGVSITAGRRYAKNLSDGFYWEPQAELGYVHYGDASYTFGGLPVKVDSQQSLVGRLGLVLGTHNVSRRGYCTDFYAKISYNNEFKGDTDVQVAGTGLGADQGGHWLNYGLGVRFGNLNKFNAYVNANISKGDHDSQVGFRAGVNFSF